MASFPILTSTSRRSLRWGALHRPHRFLELANRSLSTNADAKGKASLQSYLDGWVGLPPPSQSSSQSNNYPLDDQASPVLRARAAIAQGSLLLSGSSYLLPTLRLERGENPESLTDRLEQHASSNNIRIAQNSSQWSCPIVLDVSSLVPDGSPHYRPPPIGSLGEMVSILGRFGMKVIGVSAGSRELSSQLAEEASKVGIPSLWSPRKAGADPIMDLAQVLQLLASKQEQIEVPQLSTLDTKFEEEATLVSETRLELEPDISPSLQSQETGATDVEIRDEEKSTLLDSSSQEPPSPPLPAPMIEFSSTSTIHHGSVRSGQQVMSTKGQSLVILGSVNSGGEVLSDGDIFVFGKLRGRAFAGLGGGTGEESISARVVATSFDAELVAIGDTFTTIDQVRDLSSKVELKPGQSIMVTLTDAGGAEPSLEFVPVEL